MIVEKQLKNSMSWKVLLKILLLQTGVFCVSLALLLCLTEVFQLFQINNDTNMLCILCLVML